MNQYSGFEDLLTANREYAEARTSGHFDGIAQAGVAMVTCMDSRIEPLKMIGLHLGDAKILRNPGGRVTDATLVALVLSVSLLNVDRIMLVQHTRCAMASSSEDAMHDQLSAISNTDTTWLSLGTITDQEKTLRADVHRVTSHPLIPDHIKVGAFLYDVDTGLLNPVA